MVESVFLFYRTVIVEDMLKDISSTTWMITQKLESQKREGYT